MTQDYEKDCETCRHDGGAIKCTSCDNQYSGWERRETRDDSKDLDRVIVCMATHIKDLRQQAGWGSWGMDYDVARIISDFKTTVEDESK